MNSDSVANAGEQPTPDERNWAVISHLGALAAALFALGQILVPLGIWLWKKEDSRFIEANARESLNFQISMTIYFVIAGILAYILIGFFVIAVLVVVEIVCVVLACVSASRGEVFRYPFSLRLIS